MNHPGTGLLLTIVLITAQSCANEIKKPTSTPVNFTSYPNHTCKDKPAIPKKPGKASSFENVETYNLEISKYNINVESYNKKIKNYKTCINKYIKKGNQDINTIRQKLNKALKKAREK
ncbi:MAG: hypothetical protein KAT06_06205 [Gammaproteobacteria bacterium]|nr:hypothetical protein [Gammaproteobacteria bacterium]